MGKQSEECRQCNYGYIRKEYGTCSQCGKPAKGSKMEKELTTTKKSPEAIARFMALAGRMFLEGIV